MSSVSVNKEVTISLDVKELDTLEEAYKITKELRHDLFMADDESEEYFVADTTVSGLHELIGFAGSGGKNITANAIKLNHENVYKVRTDGEITNLLEEPEEVH